MRPEPRQQVEPGLLCKPGWLGLLTACLVVLLATDARAEVRLAPAEDGHLGAWLLAGPITKFGARKLDPASAQPKSGAKLASFAGAPRWRLVATADGALDLRKKLHVPRAGGPHALLAGVLQVKDDLDGWLLLSADGGATVIVDGKTLWSRDVKRLRDRSWDVIPLKLEPGAHTLTLFLHHRGQHWAVAVRVLDGKNLLPPPGLSLLLPGTTEQDEQKLVSSMLSLSLDAGLSGAGYCPRVALEYRRGVPRGVALDAVVEARLAGVAAPLLRASLGDIAVGNYGVHPLDALLRPISAHELGERKRAQLVSFRVHVGPSANNGKLAMSAAAPPLFDRATSLVDALARGHHPELLDAKVASATLEWRMQKLHEAAQVTTGGVEPLKRALSELKQLVSDLKSGTDPLRQPGIIDLAQASALDGRPQHLQVHVPASYDPKAKRRYPLVVLLHGYNGNPEGIMRAFLDSASRRAHTAIDGFVLAPHAHGNSFYRGPGEHAVLSALDWMQETYPIDPQRVSVTGVSMGGTGAAQLALRHAERFAAAAPLCGYQSFFVRRDTSNRPLRPWERDRMHHWSPSSFAASGRNLPLYVAHGTKDLPLENSRVLVKAYRKLGYSLIDDWPETGHSVWKKTYAGARMWPWLTRHRRDPSPAQVTLRTNSLRYAKLDWVRITELARPGKMGQLDARIVSPEKIVVTTEAVAAFELERAPGQLKPDAEVKLEVDAASLTFGPKQGLAVRRSQAGWQKPSGKPPRRHKRAGVEGPIRDALLGPLLFVFGTLDPAATRANREVARTLAKMRYRIDVRYPVIADRNVAPGLERTHSLLLVGNAHTNSIIRRLDKRLPIRVEGESVVLGKQSFQGEDVGTIFIYPNPDHPHRYVVAVEAASVRGIWRALSLPKLLPDFLIFDAGLAASAGEQVLSKGHVLAGGFFNRDWSLPQNTRDPHAP